MKKIIATILAAALTLCGAAMAETEMEALSQNISAGGIAAVGSEGELYFSLNGLQRMNAEGGVETLFEGEVSRLQYVDGALYFVGSEAVDEYGDAALETPYRLDADGVTAIGAPLRRGVDSEYGDACLTSCDTYAGYQEMTVYGGHIYYIGSGDQSGEYETIAEGWGAEGETRYTTAYSHGLSVFRMDLDGGNLTELITGLGNGDAHMAISNDRIAVSTCYRNGVYAYDFTNFLLYDLDGKLLKVVSNPGGSSTVSLRMEGQAFTVIVNSIRTDGENIYASLSDSEGDFANSRLVNVENIGEDILIEAWSVPALWYGDELIYVGSDAEDTFWDECMETTTRIIRRDAAGNETVLAYLPAAYQNYLMTPALLGDMYYLRTGDHLLRVNLTNGDVDEFNGTEFAVCAPCDPAYAVMPRLVLTTLPPEAPETEDECLLPDSDTRLYSKEELSQYDADTLALMRNEILARHGYPFQKEKYQSYFGSKSWYSVDPDFSYDSLSSIEMKNVETIKGLEG